MAEPEFNHDDFKKLVQEAKEKLGKEAIEIIAKDLNLTEIQAGKSKNICPWHDDVNASLNAYDTNFYCFGCNKNYDIIDHFMEYEQLSFPEAAQKLFDLVGIKYTFHYLNKKDKKDYKYPYYDKSENRSDVESYLAKRKISEKTLDYCDVQQSKDGKNIVFNYKDENNVLTTVKYRPAKKIKDGETKCWFQQGSDNRLILYNMNMVDPTKPLAICEGEGDCLSLIECGFTNSVSVPNGAGNFKWIEENFDWLEQFDKIIVWADSDDAGLKMRREACSRLGSWRTFYVEIPEELRFHTDPETGNTWEIKDVNEVLFWYGKDQVRELIENAQETPIVGVDNLAQVDDFDIAKAEGLIPRLKSLKDIVYKFIFGSVVLVTGYPGAGKSTFISQTFLCDSIDSHYNTFLFSGELKSSVVKSWFEWTLAGPEHTYLKDNFFHVVDKESEKIMRKWYDNKIWVYNEIDNNVDKVLDRAIATTRKYGVKVWILDNLMTLDIGAEDYNVNQQQKNFIVKLNQLAIQYNVLAVLVAHPRKFAKGESMEVQDVAGSSDLGNLVQYMVGLRRLKDGEKKKENVEFDQEISVMKNRYTGKLDKAGIFFDYGSYRFYNDYESELYYRYKWDLNTNPPKIKQKHLVKHNGPYAETGQKGSGPFYE